MKKHLRCIDTKMTRPKSKTCRECRWNKKGYCQKWEDKCSKNEHKFFCSEFTPKRKR